MADHKQRLRAQRDRVIQVTLSLDKPPLRFLNEVAHLILSFEQGPGTRSTYETSSALLGNNIHVTQLEADPSNDTLCTVTKFSHFHGPPT